MSAEGLDPTGVMLRVTSVLEALGVPYLVGGSMASIFHGMMRTTNDADLVAELGMEHVDAFAAALRSTFYLDEESIRDAIQTRSSFNVIHLDTMFKVDVFISRRRPFDLARFQRGARQTLLASSGEGATMSSAEDAILAKLEWYRLGGEVSERQWRDVLGVLKTQGARLDVAYLRTWAEGLGVLDLLERAFVSVDGNA